MNVSADGEGAIFQRCIQNHNLISHCCFFLFARLSPKLRKYSHILLPNESESQAGEINCKKNAILFCESSKNTQKLSQFTSTTKAHNRCKERKKPLVPRLYNLNEDGEASNFATGFILSPRAERPYKCNLCVKQFKYFSNLKSHMKIVHKKIVESHPENSNSSTVGNGKVFQCELCFRNFKYFSNLRTHQLVHTSNDS